ncbi:MULTISPECIES: hypothetical protein [unclassified Streptomyces]|uniref:hypothetical protein n=1 Tax=unclassified Streptomyces TaxID=2593676 RepID=UPI00168C1010|nr:MULTISPECIES: hypothetical protein [unclassified Streptomyces]MBD3007574.1 hypothetical protein [Streptomyces sp. 5-10]
MSKKPMWGAALAGALIAGGVYTAPSASAVSGPEHCAVVIKKVEPGQAESKVVSKQCAGSAEALNVKGSGTALAPAALFTLYDDSDFRGSSYTIYGNEGDCDGSGYRYPTLGWSYNDFARSIRLHGACDTANLHEHANWGGLVTRVDGYRSDLGDLNDRVSSIAVWNTY